MCGIVGYVGTKTASPILLEGLRRLEYRGYDSAGIATWDAERFRVLKKTGRVENLAKLAREALDSATLGISHTRWATHGGVTEANAHPHVSNNGKISLVHNGVIENFSSIKKFLQGKFFQFYSETDTEALANLIQYHYDKEPQEDGSSRFLSAVRKSLEHVEGAYGIAVLCTECPEELIAAAHARGLSKISPSAACSPSRAARFNAGPLAV